MTLRALKDEAFWNFVAQNDPVAIGVLRQAVVQLLDKVEQLEKTTIRDPILWCED
jgi:hypothetical protein